MENKKTIRRRGNCFFSFSGSSSSSNSSFFTLLFLAFISKMSPANVAAEAQSKVDELKPMVTKKINLVSLNKLNIF